MTTLAHAPLFKIAVFLLLGIVLSKWLGWHIAFLFIPGMMGLGWALIKNRRILSHTFEYLQALVVFLTATGFGAALYQVNQLSSPTPSLNTINCETVSIAGTTISPVKANEYGRKAWIELIAYTKDTVWVPIQGKVLLYANPDIVTAFDIHDTIFAEVAIRDVYSPYQGYLNYLHQHGIFHAAFTQSLQAGGKKESLAYYGSYFQKKVSLTLSTLFKDTTTASVAQAMFLGDKTHLSQEVKSHFAKAGLSHILAISGLHVGIIFIILSKLFAPFHLIPHGFRLKNAFILILLLMYMLITGASPAVVRAVLMLGTILFFRIIYQRYHILNLLAISALIQMLHQPGIVFHIGFQLSYAAVTGIVTLLPLFEKLFPAPYPLFKPVYDWIGVTLAATLSTLPFTLAYFGQFPVYFIASNVATSLLTFAVVMTGFLTILLCWVPGINTFLGYISEELLRVLCEIAHTISLLPGAIIDTIPPDMTSVLALTLEISITLLLLLLPRVKRFSFGQSVPQHIPSPP